MTLFPSLLSELFVVSYIHKNSLIHKDSHDLSKLRSECLISFSVKGSVDDVTLTSTVFVLTCIRRISTPS